MGKGSPSPKVGAFVKFWRQRLAEVVCIFIGHKFVSYPGLASAVCLRCKGHIKKHLWWDKNGNGHWK